MLSSPDERIIDRRGDWWALKAGLVTIYWVIFYGALLQGVWWWFVPPIVVIILLFMGLFGLAAGRDEIANPRLRKTE